jgi:hypothetical protein
MRGGYERSMRVVYERRVRERSVCEEGMRGGAYEEVRIPTVRLRRSTPAIRIMSSASRRFASSRWIPAAFMSTWELSGEIRQRSHVRKASLEPLIFWEERGGGGIGRGGGREEQEQEQEVGEV